MSDNSVSSPAPTRVERDSMGEMQVPQSALYGASTARAVDNFPISYRPVAPAVISAFGYLKAACAQANRDLGKLDGTKADAIIAAAHEVAEGQHDEHFPVDIFQTGSGTSTNMNANEVIANLANIRLGFGAGAKGQEGSVHPNDDVNMGQSSNDTFPTAMHIAGAMAVKDHFLPALQALRDDLKAKEQQWDALVKIGRTHLMDATPIRVGQVFGGYARQAELSCQRAEDVYHLMRLNMPIGGTAVGTGINTHPEFARRVCALLKDTLGIDFEEAENHPEAQAAKDSFVHAHGLLKTIAVSISKIANDIRLLGSGPRCAIGELQLPATQPGSSIMPGKVNPVICEALIQVACRVIGNDATVTTAGLGGVGSLFELNVAMPVMNEAFLESIELLSNGANVFTEKLLAGLAVDEERCLDLIEWSMSMITSLAPKIGYDKASEIAKKSISEGKTVRQLCQEMQVASVDEINQALDPMKMTAPSA